jgi:hypothetical protein
MGSVILGWLIPVANMGSLMGAGCHADVELAKPWARGAAQSEQSKSTWDGIEQSPNRWRCDSVSSMGSAGDLGCFETKAPEAVDALDAADLAHELEGTVRRAALCSHGHFALQKVVEILPAKNLGFISDELLGAAVETAKNQHGCRVLCSLLAKCGCGTQLAASTTRLADELLQSALHLSKDAQGHLVMVAILEHGSEKQRAAMVAQFQGDLVRHSRNRSMSHVIEKALACCGPELRDAMASEILAQESDLLQLAQNRFGRFVVKGLAQLEGHHGLQVQEIIHAAAKQLRANKYGARFLCELTRDGESGSSPSKRAQRGRMQAASPAVPTVKSTNNVEAVEPFQMVHGAARRRWADEMDDESEA